MDWYDPTSYASEILDAKYDKVLADDAIDQLDHLSAQQKNDLNPFLPRGAIEGRFGVGHTYLPQ
jgi:hypothetical protein